MSLNIYEEIQKSSLSQFSNKAIINGLQKAAADALQSVYDESQQLRLLGDIDKMSGKNLDVIGERLGLKRTEAYKILRKTQEVVITDEIYRRCLKWKRLANNFQGTYSEIMESIRVLWKTDNIIYKELLEFPARIFMTIPQCDIDLSDPWFGRAMALKPAGVAMVFTSDYLTSVDESAIESWENGHIYLLMKVYWSNMYVFDGKLSFDGEHTFFGWTYVLPVSITHGVVTVSMDERISGRYAQTVKNEIQESIRAGTVKTSGELAFSEILTVFSDSVTKINAEVESITGNGGVIYFHNKGFFNGEFNFNGTRNFDAYYKEEEY